uniref:Neuropeptide S receptor 1 n=1 Tax=Eptatretus burgeri TaxID=7764 RepID=A0A8C4Q3V6_EPTBU
MVPMYDILTGLVNILSNIIWRFTGEFLASDLVCRLVKYFQVVLLYASTYVLVSLSIDRYMAIVHPMKLFKGDRYSCCLIGLAWALAFLFSAPTLFLFHKKQLGNGEMQCWSDWPDDTFWTPYMTLVAFLIYFCPLMIMCVVYFFVVRKIWMKSKMTANNQRDQTGGRTVFLHRGSIPRARVKAVKYSLLIVLAFILCWSPYFIFDILDNYKLLPDTDARDFAAIIIHNLPALNSAINPFIYCFSSPKLCQNFQYVTLLQIKY